MPPSAYLVRPKNSAFAPTTQDTQVILSVKRGSGYLIAFGEYIGSTPNLVALTMVVNVLLARVYACSFRAHHGGPYHGGGAVTAASALRQDFA